MIPKTLSATSLHVADLCMSRWEAEMFNRAKGQAGVAATLGSTCHNALELFVKETQIDKKQSGSLELLHRLYRMSYIVMFGAPDDKGVLYLDGKKMMTTWFNRTDWTGHEVISSEVKENFHVNTSAGPIILNYIYDRFDRLGEFEYEIIDYKSNRMPISNDELRTKIQARVYALAGQIKYPEAKRIWVTFDMLRHTQVTVAFSRDDNAETYRTIQALAEKIIATPEGLAEPTLNDECLFCPKKVSCPEVTKNINIGGINSIDSLEEAADLRALLVYQMNAAKAAKGELDDHIMQMAQAEDRLEIHTPLTKMTFTARKERSVSGHDARAIVGEDIFTSYGKDDLTMAGYDEMLKDPRLTSEQLAELRKIVTNTTGNPYVVTKGKTV